MNNKTSEYSTMIYSKHPRYRYYSKIMFTYYWKVEAESFYHRRLFFIIKFIMFENLQFSHHLSGTIAENLVKAEIENGGVLPEKLQNIMNEIILEIM